MQFLFTHVSFSSNDVVCHLPISDCRATLVGVIDIHDTAS